LEGQGRDTLACSDSERRGLGASGAVGAAPSLAGGSGAHAGTESLTEKGPSRQGPAA
jgi:hypothetical protein